MTGRAPVRRSGGRRRFRLGLQRGVTYRLTAGLHSAARTAQRAAATSSVTSTAAINSPVAMTWPGLLPAMSAS